MSACRHDKLTFGSGGYYVFCHACGAQWVATGDAEGPATTDQAIENRRRAVSNVCQSVGTTFAYFVGRNDLSGGAEVIYAFHAGRECAGPAASTDERACALMATKAQLAVLMLELKEAGIPFKAFEETDGQLAGSIPVVSFSIPLEEKASVAQRVPILPTLKRWSERARGELAKP